jgi:hypothetical protein
MDATKLADALAPVPGLVEQHGAIARVGPADGSVAAGDVTRPEGHRIWIVANQMWASAVEHAMAWHQLLIKAKYIPRSAHYTLLRGTFEGVVTCRYAIDQTVSQSMRVSRACALQLEDWRQRKNFEEDSGIKTPPSPAKTASERIDDLRKAMKANGIAEVTLPKMIQLFESHGDGSWLYRVLSAHAHGLEWSFLTGQMTPAEDPSPIPGSGAGIISASETLTLQMTELAVMRLEKSFAELRRFAGR